MMKSKMASKGGARGGRKPMGMKSGGPANKFPDLNKDGKVTQADILKGRGVVGGRSRAAEKKKTAENNKRMTEKKRSFSPAKRKFTQVESAYEGAKKKAMGGMMKSKGMAKGGAMKKKGYAMGGMTKKGMAKGGPVKKKAVSRKPRGVGAALRGFGKALR